MKSIIPSDLPVPQLHQILLGSVGPRPIALASTIDKKGTPNLAPFSFFNVFSAAPPVLVFSPARSGRTGATKDTYNNIREVPEVVINVVTREIVHQVSLASVEYEPEVNEFEKAGFTPLPSDMVKPFRVAESPVHMECRVNQVIELGKSGGAGNLIVCEILKIHLREDVLDTNGMIDPRKIKLVSRMGANWYCLADGESLFEIDKPMSKKSMGIDQLPEKIRNNKILTGSDLARLADWVEIPAKETVAAYKKHYAHCFATEEEIFQYAHVLIQKNRVEEAWLVLLSNLQNV